jgi:polyisoprenoid-binding protein YceI
MTATQTKIETGIPAGKWHSDRVHSSATFEVGHLGTSTFRGRVRDFDASLVAGEDGLVLDGTARVESLDIDEENLRAHLLSPEFFDAERHPEIRFRADRIGEDGDGLVVHGELEIKGHGGEVEAQAKVGPVVSGPDGSERVALDLDTTIDRTEYGLNWNMELPNGGQALGNEVRLVVNLELIREEA